MTNIEIDIKMDEVDKELAAFNNFIHTPPESASTTQPEVSLLADLKVDAFGSWTLNSLANARKRRED